MVRAILLGCALLLGFLPSFVRAQCAAGAQVMDKCSGYTFEGCCTEDGKVRWCENGVTCEIDCANLNPECGWNNDAGFYDCANLPGQDPTCNNPYSCIKGGCLPTTTKGCCNCPCQECVCALDPFCCNNQWDASCALTCKEECDGCGSITGCGKSATPGCGGCECELCVCELDPYCCQHSWDSICAEECDEDCNSECACQPDCDGKECGPDGCQGNCGNCKAGFVCDALGHCKCQPDCGGKQCGSDGCGGQCGGCPGGYACVNGHCDCVPDCVAKQCGDDGCQGSCGECKEDFKCTNFHCSPVCLPNCSGKQCGDDGCGKSCGECPPGSFCDDQNLCTEICMPDCQDKQCGDDGCQGSCGACPQEYVCNDQFQCEELCTPDCINKQCGDDGCKGSCGTCPDDYYCHDGLCKTEVCLPDCTDKQCGADGCEGSCGNCGFDLDCIEHKCVDTSQPEEDVLNGATDVVQETVNPAPDGAADSATADSSGWAEPQPDASGPDGSDARMPDAKQSTTCPPGQSYVYGKCVPLGEKEEPVDKSGGCGHSPASNPAPGMALLLLSLLTLYVRRQHN